MALQQCTNTIDTTSAPKRLPGKRWNFLCGFTTCVCNKKVCITAKATFDLPSASQHQLNTLPKKNLRDLNSSGCMRTLLNVHTRYYSWKRQNNLPLESFPRIQTQQTSYCTFYMEQMAFKKWPHTFKESLQCPSYLWTWSQTTHVDATKLYNCPPCLLLINQFLLFFVMSKVSFVVKNVHLTLHFSCSILNFIVWF